MAYDGSDQLLTKLEGGRLKPEKYLKTETHYYRTESRSHDK